MHPFIDLDMKYIDTDQLKVEIERLKQENSISDDKEYAQYELDVACGYDMALEKVLLILNSLQQEHPEVDLEKEITRTYHDGSVADTSDMDHNDYENIARHFYELGCRHVAVMYDDIEYKEQMVDELTTKELVDEIVEEYKKYVDDDPVFSKHVNKVAGISIARHFAEWGAKQVKSND